MAKTGQWSFIALDTNEAQDIPHFNDLCAYESGTLIVWQNLDRLKAGEINFEETLGRKIDGVREHISLVFHRYLSGEPTRTPYEQSRIAINRRFCYT